MKDIVMRHSMVRKSELMAGGVFHKMNKGNNMNEGKIYRYLGMGLEYQWYRYGTY